MYNSVQSHGIRGFMNILKKLLYWGWQDGLRFFKNSVWDVNKDHFLNICAITK